jgi:2-methylcitrate dehydratase PrpD
VAHALLHGSVGLDAFTDANARDPRIIALASKVRHEIDPANPYPDEYTGHVRIDLADGKRLEERQPHLRGGHREPLSRMEIEEKFRSNCRYGGWDDAHADAWLDFVHRLTVIPDVRATDHDPGSIVALSPFRG